jgi:flagellar biogenesis protein FliO
MKRERELRETDSKAEAKRTIGGWAGWLLARLRTTGRHEPRLQLLERITLAPRQSLALVEADGRRLLVATSADGGPAFYALDRRMAEVDARKAGAPRVAVREHSQRSERSGRVSW